MHTKPDSSIPHRGWLALLLGVACLVFLAGPLPVSASPDPSTSADDQGRASATRGGGSSSGGSSSGGSQGRASVSRGSGGGGASATRPGGGSGGSGRTEVHRPPSSSRPPSGHRGHGGHGGYYSGYYGYRGYSHFPYFGFSFFRYPYYLGFRYPYTHYGPVWYDYPAYASLGGLDLNVRPKKAQVFIDGQRIGRVGRFDGYPGVLWLEEGTYDLVIYHPGYRTLHQKVRVFAGVVIDLDERMVAGEAIPPEELVPPPVEPPPERSAQVTPAPGGSDRQVDLGHEPARLHLTVDPPDASVYLDGRFLGTGDELAGLRSGLMVNPGEHRLAVVRPSYDSEELTVDVAAGEDVELAVQLRPVGGR